MPLWDLRKGLTWAEGAFCREYLIDSLNASWGLGRSYTLAMQFLLFVTWKKSFNAKMKKLLRPQDPGLQNTPELAFKGQMQCGGLSLEILVGSGQHAAW